jgi:ABC-type branched-subunit amino acid transport system substrate-binding protein
VNRTLATLLALLVLLPALASAASKAEERAWKRVVTASEKDPASTVLMRVDNYLETYPDGDWKLPAMLQAARALMALEDWTDARSRFQGYLTSGGRKAVEEASFGIALCLARERRTEDATAALHNVAVNDSDAARSRSAARELAALHAFDGASFRSLDALGLLVDRKLFEADEDLSLSRKYAEDISDEDLRSVEAPQRGTAVGSLLALLLLDREEQLLDSEETEEARRRYAGRYPESSLLALVPGAEAFAAEPEDVEVRTIGLLLPDSGKFAAPGALARRGVDLAMDAGTALGWEEIQLVALDTQGDPEVARAALKTLVEEHKVVGVLGPLISAEAETVALEAEELGVPLVMMTQRAGLAVDRANVFNTWSTPEEQAEKLVEHAMGRMGLERFAIAYPETEVAARAAARFWDRVEENGGQVVAVESFHADEKDFRKTGQRLKGSFYVTQPPGEGDLVLPYFTGRSKPQIVEPQLELVPGVDFQAVFVPTNYKQATMVAPGFLYEEINIGGHLDTEDYPAVTFMGGSALNHPGLVDRGGKYMEGTVLVDGFFADSPDGPGGEFAAAYRARWETSPSILEAVAHDAAFHLIQLVAEGVAGRRELRRRLGVSTPRKAVTGSRGFGEDGEMRHELLTLTVRKGSIVQVWPPPAGEEKEETPSFQDGDVLPARPEGASEEPPSEEETETP